MSHPDARFRMDDAAMRSFVAARGFAHLFCHTPEGPMAAHVPFVIAGDLLSLHLARANRLIPHLDGATVLAVVSGPDGYVSPDWYGVADQVPTWNYVAVEMEGVARRCDEGLIAQLDDLSAEQETRLLHKRPWTRGKMAPGRFEAMLPALGCFEVAVTAWRGTAKLGQNKPIAVRRAAAEGVRAAGRVELAALMDRA